MRPRRRPRQPTPPRTADDRLPPAVNRELRAAILSIVDEQLSSGDPPETRQTLDRLVESGHSPEGARQLIAQVVAREIYTVMARGDRYDAARYRAALAGLPSLPPEEPAGAR